MELAYLPKNKATVKTYKHFTVNSSQVKESNPGKKTEFFYIGKNAAVIDNLIDLFDCGYAAENVEKAISILSKIIEKRATYPDMILVDGALGIPTLHKLNQFLSSSPFFSLIPLMIESASISPSIINDLRKLSFVDDIIEIRQSDAKLHHKIRFVKKIKDFNNQKELQRKIQRPANYMTPKGGFFKRSFDILVSSMALIALSPIFLVIGIAIRMESKGPIFYIAKRAGRGYRIFSFFKFRTMQIDADKKVAEMSHLNQYDAATGPVFFKVSNDPRITKVGAFLRNTSLDEFPQLFNVLIGDMSLVGNRPLPLYEAQTLTTDEWAARFMAPAGMTGLWQIKKRGQKDMSVEERISLDITYAHRNNFMYDLWIMANTPTALMQKTNA